MDTFANPYATTSPIASALANLSRAITTGPTEAENILRTEAALKLKRQREGTTDVASVFQDYGTPTFDRNRVMSSAIIGGYDPKNLAELERYATANQFGVNDPRTTNAFVGAGGGFGQTPIGTREAQALDLYKFNQTPQVINTPQGPMISTRQAAIGQQAVEPKANVEGSMLRNNWGNIGGLPIAEQRVLGAESKTTPSPHNYIGPNGEKLVAYAGPGGLYDPRTNQPVPQGGLMVGVTGNPNDTGLRPTVQGDLQKQDITNQRFRALLGFTKNLAAQDATNFGVTGVAKGLVQDAGQVANNVALGLGYTGFQEAVAEMRQKALASGVNPGLFSGAFDPKLPALHTAADLLVYHAAEALAGQAGRSVSDKDVHMFRSIVGDPREWFGNQEKFIAKLDTIEQILNLNQSVIDQNLRRSGTPAAAAPAAPGAPPVPQAAPGAPPSAAPAAPGPVDWRAYFGAP